MTPPPLIDKHILYEASVQDPAVDIALIERMTRRSGLGRALRLREDFCGTALLACAWAQSDPHRHAVGVDLHPPTLEWAQRHRLSVLDPDSRARVELVHADVLDYQGDEVDVVAALNFSYMVFDRRELLKAYFRRVWEQLAPGGVFLLDLFGGPHAQEAMKERKRVPAGADFAGTPFPEFEYVWEQASFNAVDQHIQCHIHFRGPGIQAQPRAFSYSWRLWSITEITDVLTECGFVSVEPYFEGWCDETNSTDGVLRRRSRYEDMLAWISYLSAAKGMS
jgi:SAM-dependent methyltransferase